RSKRDWSSDVCSSDLSSACDVLPLRAAEIASLTAAISADGIEIGTGEVAATERGAAEPLDWALDLAFFSGVLALAALLLSLSLLDRKSVVEGKRVTVG